MLTQRPPPGTSQFPKCNGKGTAEDWVTKTPEFAGSDTTLFLVDYDDTILASSWLAGKGLRLDSPSVPQDVSKELALLETRAIALLEDVMNRGKVALVTNAEQGWIELSARKFLPGIVPLLEKLRILSARTAFEQQFPNKTQMWKNAAYDLIFAEAFGDAVQSGFEGKFNIISLGDSLYERSALLHLASKMPSVVAKSVKLIERPTMSQLQRQLEIIEAHMGDIVPSKETIDLMLTVDLVPDPDYVGNENST